MVTEAVSSELKQCNCIIVNSGLTVEIEINRFHMDFKDRVLLGNCVSEILLNVIVVRPDGTITFSKTIISSSEDTPTWISSSSNAKIALESSLSDAISKVINDRHFLRSTLQKG